MYQLQGETDDDQNECVTDEVLVAVVHDRVGKPPCGQERNTGLVKGEVEITKSRANGKGQ